MSKLSRTKGKRGELEAAQQLTELLGVPVARSQQYRGNAGAADLDGLPGLHVEIKRRERLALYEAMEQADQDAGADDIPVLIHRPNRRPWVLSIYLSDLRAFVTNVNRILERAEAEDPGR